MDDKEIRISFPIKHSDNTEENLNNVIILKMQSLFGLDTDTHIHPYNVEVKIQNKIIDDLISCLNQKRKVNFDEEQ